MGLSRILGETSGGSNLSSFKFTGDGRGGAAEASENVFRGKGGQLGAANVSFEGYGSGRSRQTEMGTSGRQSVPFQDHDQGESEVDPNVEYRRRWTG